MPYSSGATDANTHLFYFFKWAGSLRTTKKNPAIAFEKRYDVIYGNYVTAYLDRTGLIKTEHGSLNPKTILKSDKCLYCRDTSKNWMEWAESVLCCIYFCFLHKDSLHPRGKKQNLFPQLPVSSPLCVCMPSCVWLFVTPWCPAGSSVHGILQARLLEWVTISFSRGSSQPRDRTHISCMSCIGRRILYQGAAREAPYRD